MVRLRKSSNSMMKIDVPAVYKIHVSGTLGSGWSQYLGGAVIKPGGDPDRPSTMLTGCARDQAALMGILNALYDLGMPLISCVCDYSVNSAEPSA